MRLTGVGLVGFIVVLLVPAALLAQSPEAAASSSVPRVVNLSGIFTPADGQRPGVEVVTLAVYAEETGGDALWSETQTITVDPSGRYALLLGATQAEGVPLDVFASGEARWLGMVWARPGEVEGARMRLTSVPYALRAADADTLGGRPASAYVLSPAAGGDGAATTTSHAATSGSVAMPAAVNPGTTNSLAKYVNGVDVGTSAVFEVNGLVGVNTAAPKDVLHSAFFNGNGTMAGLAVQNLSNTANAYSGMLFYDHTGALGQFQGFNNITKEYRVNNIAMGGSINFMLGGTSRLAVRSDGRITVGALATISSGLTGALGQAAGWTPPGATVNGGIFIEGSGDGESGGFYADGNTAALWSTGDGGALLRVYDEDNLVAPSSGSPSFVIDGFGNINVGFGTTGCVRDGDGTILIGTCFSDERLKKDIRTFDGGMLERALKLRPVYYRWRTELMTDSAIPENAGEAYGFIAQEVEKIYPEMVTTTGEGYKAVDYTKLSYVLLGAVQEQHTKVQTLDAKAVTLEKRLATLEAMMDGEAGAKGWLPAGWLVLAGLGALGSAFVGVGQVRAWRRRSMRLIHAVVVFVSAVVLSSGAVLAQHAAQPAVPRVINISGVFTPADGRISGVNVVTLSIYADETGGQPLWHETQSINIDSAGRYALLLGATQADGVPLDVFASGEARWLGMVWTRPGEVEGPRMRLTSVPYALRAADADTLGGRPASAYVLSPAAGGDGAPTTSSNPATSASFAMPLAVNPGTTNSLAKYVNGTDVGTSAVFEVNGLVGVNTAAPKDVLHSAFFNGNGTMTGLAVQNLSNTATSYSGMLFYDHNGALGQFQGFNNSTKEYRVNNIAPAGTINFMTGSTSRLFVGTTGNIGIGMMNPLDKLHVAGDIRVGDKTTTGCVKDFAGRVLTGVCSSDVRLKKDVAPFGPVLASLTALQPVHYFWRAAEFPEHHFGTARSHGLIAQDVEQVLPELVVTDADGYKAVNYSKLPLLTIQAVKELNGEVTALRTENDALKTRVAELERLVKALVTRTSRR